MRGGHFIRSIYGQTKHGIRTGGDGPDGSTHFAEGSRSNDADSLIRQSMIIPTNAQIIFACAFQLSSDGATRVAGPLWLGGMKTCPSIVIPEHYQFLKISRDDLHDVPALLSHTCEFSNSRRLHALHSHFRRVPEMLTIHFRSLNLQRI